MSVTLPFASAIAIPALLAARRFGSSCLIRSCGVPLTARFREWSASLLLSSLLFIASTETSVPSLSRISLFAVLLLGLSTVELIDALLRREPPGGAESSPLLKRITEVTALMVVAAGMVLGEGPAVALAGVWVLFLGYMIFRRAQTAGRARSDFCAFRLRFIGAIALGAALLSTLVSTSIPAAGSPHPSTLFAISLAVTLIFGTGTGLRWAPELFILLRISAALGRYDAGDDLARVAERILALTEQREMLPLQAFIERSTTPLVAPRSVVPPASKGDPVSVKASDPLTPET